MKTQPSELAIRGGAPLFTEPLHVGRPNIGDRERFMELAGAMFDRRWLTNNGPLVQELERRLASYLGVAHVVTLCNATVGLELAARALGLSGEVILPSFTFVATAHALHWQGIRPVFVDIDPATHNVDPAAVEAAITPRTTGIVGVHVWGRPCAVDALESMSRRRGLKLMFDAAHAFAGTHRGRRIGNSGLCEVFSFHATKFFNTFEGGAISTNDDALAAKLRLMRNFGFQGFDNVIYPGINGKMTEVCAAMGLTNLESIEDVIAVNRRNYDAYLREFAGLPGVTCIRYAPSEEGNYQHVVVEIDGRSFGLTRDEVYSALHAENLLVRRYFHPGCHRMEPYRTLYPELDGMLPHTEALCARVLAFPTGTAVSVADIGAIGSLLRVLTTHAGEIRAQLGKGR